MEEIAKIFKINKTGIMQTFIILIICSVAGNIIHDVIMLKLHKIQYGCIIWMHEEDVYYKTMGV